MLVSKVPSKGDASGAGAPADASMKEISRVQVTVTTEVLQLPATTVPMTPTKTEEAGINPLFVMCKGSLSSDEPLHMYISFTYI